MKRLTTRGRETAEAIRDREPFTTSGALWAVPGDHGTGRLPEPWLAQYNAAWLARELDYVVYSYATPIAWHTAAGWTFPDVKYSPTTSHHQGVLYAAKNWQREQEARLASV
jgi:hypothetical protein